MTLQNIYGHYLRVRAQTRKHKFDNYMIMSETLIQLGPISFTFTPTNSTDPDLYVPKIAKLDRKWARISKHHKLVEECEKRDAAG